MRRWLYILILTIVLGFCAPIHAADVRISSLPELTSGSIADADMFLVVDATGPTSKKHLWSSLKAEITTHLSTVYQGLYVVDALVTYGGGTAYTKATIDAALAAIGTVNKTVLLLAPGTWTITDNSDYSAYSNVIFYKPGATFALTATKTLTLPSRENLDTPKNQQAFSGTGLVSFARPSDVTPELWGIDGTADQIEINKALASLAAGGRVELSQASYTVAAAITPTTKTTLYISPATTINLANSSNTDVVSIAVTDVVVTGGGAIDGNAANQTCSWPTTSSSGIRIEASRVKISGINIVDCWWAGVVTEGLVGAHLSDITVEGCDISDCDDNGVRIGNWTDRTKIVKNYIHGNGVSNTGGNRRGISTLQHITDLLIRDNTVSSNYENGIYIWTDNAGVRILDNYVASNNHFGIETSSASCVIKGNHVVGNGGQTTDDGGIWPFSKNIVEGNFVDGNLNHGIYVYQQANVIVAGNIVRNTATGGGTPHGIRLYDPTNCLVSGNIAFDDQSPKTQSHGFIVSNIGGVVGTPFVGNLSVGNTNNYIYGVSEETPLVGNIQSAAGYELGDRPRATAYVATISGDLNFDPAFYHKMLINGGASSRNINPAGTFRPGAEIRDVL